MLKTLNDLHAPDDNQPANKRPSVSSLLSSLHPASISSLSASKRNQRFSLAPAVNFYRASGGRKYDFRKRFSQQYDAAAAASSELVKKSSAVNDNNKRSADDGAELNQESKNKTSNTCNTNSRFTASNAAAVISFSDFSSPSLIFWQKMKDKSQSVSR